MKGVGGGLHLTVDRNGWVTWGWGGGVGIGGKGPRALGLSFGTYGPDMGSGLPRHQRPTEAELRALNTGWSVNLSAAIGVGIGATWPKGQPYTGTEFLLAAPGVGLTAGKSYELRRVEWLSW